MMDTFARSQQSCLASGIVPAGSRPEGADVAEGEAIRSAQRGEADGFARIYQSYCRRVYALCLRMVGNPAEAEDLAQETFLTVLRKVQTFRGESAFSTWLHRITVNVVLMRLRKKAVLEFSTDKTIELDSDRCTPDAESCSSSLRVAESVERLHLERAIEQLRPAHRIVFELHDVQGYKHKEIAQMMGCSIGNSKAQLHRARRRLRELLHDTVRLGWRVPGQALHAQFNGG